MRLGDLLAPEEVLPEAYVDRIEVIRTGLISRASS
jgi:hypothetical protein